MFNVFTLSNGRNSVRHRCQNRQHCYQKITTLPKGRNFMTNSFDIVAVLSNKAECCFDIVAGVDRALDSLPSPQYYVYVSGI